jgi:hypothetical protein
MRADSDTALSARLVGTLDLQVVIHAAHPTDLLGGAAVGGLATGAGYELSSE